MRDKTAKIEAEIRRWISGATLELHGKLPSERELMDRFGAARTTIRLALTRLAAQGLITAEHGRGYFVCRRPEARSPWRVHGERTVYDSPWVQLARVDVEPPGCARFEHHVVRLARVAVAAALDSQDRVLMLWRYRFVPASWGWELPGGIMEGQETGEQAAARELLEETGWRAGPMRHILTFQPQIGMVDSPHELYVCRAVEQIGEPQDGEEAAGLVEWVPLSAIPPLLARGELAGSGTLIALLHILAFSGGRTHRVKGL